MSRRRQATGSVVGWLSNQFWNTSLLWLLTFFAAGVIFYTVTTNTLETHSKDLAALKATLVETKRDNSVDREKVRDAFVADSKATAVGIAELNKQTAVMAAALASMDKALDKISQRLEVSPTIQRR